MLGLAMHQALQVKGECEALAWINSGGAVSVGRCLGFGIFFISFMWPYKGPMKKEREENRRKERKKEGRKKEV